MKTTVVTDAYREAHGTKPSGTRHWVFSPSVTDGDGAWCNFDRVEITAPYSKALAQAKTLATREARTIGRAKQLFIHVEP